MEDTATAVVVTAEGIREVVVVTAAAAAVVEEEIK